MKNTLRSTLTAYSRYITETWLNVSLAANIYHRGNIWSQVLLESSNSLRYINSEGGKSPTISSHIVLKDFITKNKYLKEWHKTKFGWLVVLFAIFLFIFLFCRLTLKLKKKINSKESLTFKINLWGIYWLPQCRITVIDSS